MQEWAEFFETCEVEPLGRRFFLFDSRSPRFCFIWVQKRLVIKVVQYKIYEIYLFFPYISFKYQIYPIYRDT